jgi:YHS domain-containing protein
MPTPQRVETGCSEQFRRPFSGRRNIDRRFFLRAAFGATVGIASSQPFPLEGVAFAGEAAAGKEPRKKDPLSKTLLAARCPVTGDSVSKEFSIDYRLGKLYFCSAECIKTFRADRAKYEAKANAQLVITGQFEQVHCPVTGDKVAPRVRMKICGVDVGFSSADCAKKVRRASADQRTDLVFGDGFDKGFAIRQAKAAARSSSAAGMGEDKWQCADCGYVHTGASPPPTCPECGAKSDAFNRVS